MYILTKQKLDELILKKKQSGERMVMVGDKISSVYKSGQDESTYKQCIMVDTHDHRTGFKIPDISSCGARSNFSLNIG
jgi:hypothetical protein